MTDEPFGDALSRPFWDAARREELLIQRCVTCATYQFYPRPFCVRCGGPVEWVAARGTGRVYSRTTIRIGVVPGLDPPYVAAIVELDEGPRMLALLTDHQIAIGDPVAVGWQAREGAPPMPVFGPA